MFSHSVNGLSATQSYREIRDKAIPYTQNLNRAQ